MDVKIIDNAAQQRLEAFVDGELCVVDYGIEAGTLAIWHTGVPTAVEGRGIAAALTKRAFEIARERGLKVDPRCAYTRAWLRRHPEQSDLVVAGG